MPRIQVIVNFMHLNNFKPKKELTQNLNDQHHNDFDDNIKKPMLSIYYFNEKSKADNIKNTISKLKKISVKMENIYMKITSNKIPIIFYYKDATQKNLADEIWGVLLNEYEEIERKIDPTIESNFKIVIK